MPTMEDEHDQGDGIDTGRSAATVTAVLPHGTTLLLYTDGLIERRGEIIDAGLARLLSVAAPLAGSHLHASLREVTGQLRGHLARRRALLPEGDFRDWSDITGWGAGIAGALKERGQP